MPPAGEASAPTPRRRVLDLLGDAVLSAAALTAVLLSGTARAAAVTLIVLSLAWISFRLGQRLRRGLAQTGRTPSVLGSATLGRAAVVVAVAALYRSRSTTEVVLVVLAAAVLLGLVSVEPYLMRAERFRVPVVSHLPGVARAGGGSRLGLPTVLAGLAASAVGLLIGALDLPAVWWLVVSVLAVVPAVGSALVGRRKILDARRLRREVPRAVAAYAPEYLLYTARPDDASYQVTMWLPYLQRAGRRFLVVTRSPEAAEALAARTDLPVVEARRSGDLDALITPSLQAALYVNASSGNGAFVRYQHLTHIYLGHGDSDKPPSYNPTHAMYDQVFAAGPAATRRYAAHGVRMPMEKFRIVGRPQVEGVRPATGAIADVAEPVVLYAPTWRGHVEETMFYSLPRGEQIVTALLERGATVMFRPHPFNYDFADDAATVRRIQALLESDARRTGRAHLWGPAAESERDVLACANDSDAMVSDVSAVVSDYLFSGKPFAMVAVPTDPESFVEEYPVAGASYVVRGDLANLTETLAQMLGPDPMSGRRAAVRADYLGDFGAEDYSAVFVRAIQGIGAKDAEDLAAEEPAGDPDRAAGAGGAEDEAAAEERTGKATAGDGAAGDGAAGDGAAGDGAAGDGAAGDDETGDEDTSRPRSRLAGYWRAFSRPAFNLLATAVAVVGLASLLVGASVWSVSVLGWLAAAVALFPQLANLRVRTRWSRLLSTSVLTRTVLLGTLTLLVLSSVRPTLAVGIGLALLGVALVTERHVKSAWGRVGVEATGLPTLGTGVNELLPRGTLTLAGWLALAVGFLLVALGVPASVTVLGPVVLVVLLVVLVPALQRARRAAVAEAQLRDALVAYRPEFAVYFASTVGAGYQVGMWLPYFVRIGRPFVVITRTVPMLRQIARLCEQLEVSVPLVYRPTLRSLEEVIVPSMTAAFYVNNAVRNTHFIERRELTHVWLNHGDSEKPACYNPVHAIYDLLFTAGQAGIDRYARHGVDIPGEKFRVVGRPQVEQISPARGPVVEQQPPTVLYAPTWQGPYADTRVYSLPLGQQIVQALLDRGARVVFRAHPFNYRYPECRDLIARIGTMLEGDRRRTGREHLWGEAAERELTVEDCFNLSDAMVSDVSAVVSDYLHSGKPFAMVSVGRTPDELELVAPAARAAYVLREDLSNLSAVLDDLLDADPLAGTRDATRVYYLGDFDHEHYADGFLQEARRVIDSPHQVSVGATRD